jgi:hypothetical protein
MGLAANGASSGIFLYALESRSYRQVAPAGRTPILLSDGRHLVYDLNGELRFLDTTTGSSTGILTVGTPSLSVNQRQFRISRDDRLIVFLRNEVESDIWLMSPE